MIGLEEIKNYYKDLTFEEKSHTYHYRGARVPLSVSGKIKQYYIPFDVQKQAEIKSFASGLPVSFFLDDWKEINEESTTRGTRVHLFGEQYPFDKSLSPSCPQEEAVKKFWDGLPPHIILIGVEIRMYCPKGNYAGTMDILLYDTIENVYFIADYKTNKDIFKNFDCKPMVNGFEHKIDMAYSHYEIQLSYYQKMIEQINGIKVTRRLIIYLKMDGNFDMYDCDDVRHLLN